MHHFMLEYMWLYDMYVRLADSSTFSSFSLELHYDLEALAMLERLHKFDAQFVAEEYALAEVSRA
jgi:hypothetical protein